MAYYLPYLANTSGGADPYIWFSGFNKNLFPPHSSAGAWGAQRTIKEAVAPTTTTNVNVANLAQLQTAYNLGARHITLTASIEGSDSSDITLEGDTTDTWITVPSPFRIAYLNFGTLGPDGQDFDHTITRLKLDGTGQYHKIVFRPRSGSTDLIIENTNVTGPAFASPNGNRGALLIDAKYHIGTPMDRVALTSIKGAAGGWFYGGHVTNMTVVNCSILSAIAAGNQEAWGWRHYPVENSVFWGNDIRSATTRTGDVYHRIRLHVNFNFPNGAYAWVSGNTFVDRVEARIFEVNSGMGDSSNDWGNHAAVWLTNNTVVATSTAGSSVRIGDSDLSIITGNDFQSDRITSSSNLSVAADGTVSSAGLNPTLTPNTYSSLPGSDPAWGGAGDPSGLTWNF